MLGLANKNGLLALSGAVGASSVCAAGGGAGAVIGGPYSRIVSQTFLQQHQEAFSVRVAQRAEPQVSLLPALSKGYEDHQLLVLPDSLSSKLQDDYKKQILLNNLTITQQLSNNSETTVTSPHLQPKTYLQELEDYINLEENSLAGKRNFLDESLVFGSKLDSMSDLRESGRTNLQDVENIISYKNMVVPPNHRNDVHFFQSFSDPRRSSSDSSQPPKDEGPDLDEVGFKLVYNLNNIFNRDHDWSIYHSNLLFEDRIRGKIFEGLPVYAKQILLLRALANARFVYVRFNILNIEKRKDDSTIRVRWKIAGIGQMRFIIRFIPDKMWRRGNMEKSTKSWVEGYSTFYVGKDNLIYKHVADNRMPDDDKAVLNPVLEKLKKLKPNPAPAPAI